MQVELGTRMIQVNPGKGEISLGQVGINKNWSRDNNIETQRYSGLFSTKVT